MLPAKRDLSIWKGNTFELALRFGAGEPIVPRNITGSVFIFHGAWAGGALRRQSDISGWTLDPPNGRATLELSEAETKLINAATFKYELIEHLPGGQYVTRLYGTVTVEKWLDHA